MSPDTYIATHHSLTRLRWLALRQLVNGDSIAVETPRRFVMSGAEIEWKCFEWLAKNKYIRFDRMTSVYAITDAGQQAWEDLKDETLDKR